MAGATNPHSCGDFAENQVNKGSPQENYPTDGLRGRRFFPYLLIGLICYLPLLALGSYRQSVPLFLVALLPCYFFLLASYRACVRGRLRIKHILLCSFALRLLFLPQLPSLSEDIYRYLWDGMLLTQGQNPYPLAPQQLPQFQAEHPDLYEAMAHRTRTSIYPAAAQLLFLLSNLLWGPSVIGWKCLLLAFESLFFLVLIRGFRVTPEKFCLWALNPLVLLEFYSSGHVDLVAVVFFVGGIYLLSSRSVQFWSPVLLAGATLVKIYPAFTIPLFLARWLRRRHLIKMTSIYTIAIAVPSLLLILSWGGAADSLASFWNIFSIYRESWRFNSLPYLLVESNRQTIQPYLEGFFLLSVLLLARIQKDASWQDLVTRIYFLLLVLYLVSHTVHPWYVSWVLALYPLLGLQYLAGLYLAAASFVSYFAYWWKPEGERIWLLWLEYIPFYILFLRDVYTYYVSRNGATETLPDDQS